MAAPARAVKLPAIKVAEMLSGIRRSLSMMWMMPLSNSMSYVSWRQFKFEDILED